MAATYGSSKKRGGSVRVRGACTSGHVTETTSEPGRVTWHGKCADKDCDLTVYCKRVPREVRPPQDDAAVSPPEDDPHAVREVDYDKPVPKHEQRRRESPAAEAGNADEGSGGRPVPPAVDAAPAAGPVVEQQPERQPAGDVRPDGGVGDGRLVGRRRRARERKPDRFEFRAPGW